jgi:hypothetical protein
VDFRGYIDESYNAHVFTLSCLISTGKIWSEFSRAWKLTLDSVNRKLKAQGRTTVSRYHAADCSNLKREFADWTTDEQRARLASSASKRDHAVWIQATLWNKSTVRITRKDVAWDDQNMRWETSPDVCAEPNGQH